MKGSGWEWKGAPWRGPGGVAGDVSGAWAALCAGQCCCYTEGSATSPKVLISRLVERQRTVMWRALTLVHTLRQLFPPAPTGTERREERSRCKTPAAMASNKQQWVSFEEGWVGRWRRMRKKREEVSWRGRKKERNFRKKSRSRKQKREGGRGGREGELTVKARASSPELSVGSPVSGYHAVWNDNGLTCIFLQRPNSDL